MIILNIMGIVVLALLILAAIGLILAFSFSRVTDVGEKIICLIVFLGAFALGCVASEFCNDTNSPKEQEKETLRSV